MNFILIAARKDIARRLADPAALCIWIGVPLVIGSLMSLVAGGGGGITPKAQILLVDQDDSFLSNFLAGSGGGKELGEFLEIESVNLEEGRERINDGDATAMLVLPEGFADAVLRDEPTELLLVTNPAQRILPKMVVEALEMLVEGSFYFQRVLGEPVRDLMDQEPEDEDFYPDAIIAGFSGDINRRMRELEDTLFPPVLKLQVEVESEDDDEGGGFNFGLFFLPGVIFMSLLFIAQGMSDDLWKERELGTLRRVASTPRTLFAFLAGKLAAGSVLMFAVGGVGLLFASVAFDLSFALLPIAIPWAAFGGTVLFCLFLLIQTFATSQRGGSVLTTMVLFPLMMIGGSFFPFEAMPDWMANAGAWTPNGLAVVHLKELLGGELHVGALLVSGLGMLVPGAAAFLYSLHRLRTRFLGP